MPLATEIEEDLVSFASLDYRHAYREFTYDYPSYSSTSALRRGFLRQLAKKTNEPDRVASELGWCGRCTYPEQRQFLTQVQGGTHVCRLCVPSYTQCGSCNTLARGQQYRTLDYTSLVCHRCYTQRNRYCSVCDGYYNIDNRAQHRHHGDLNSCCVSPQTKFKVKNNGNGMLKNDRKAKVVMADGMISPEGMQEIRNLVLNERYQHGDEQWSDWVALGNSLNVIGAQWQTKEGNFAKRLSRRAYKEHGLKVPPKLMTLVGNTARDHSTAVDFTVAFTRKLNLPARNFAHEGSCWWSSYSGSRCALKTNGGFGIRTFSGKRVTGRAWIIPLRKKKTAGFKATFDTETADAFIVFNGYGDLNGYTPARILSYMTGMTYRKVEFRANPMYVNSGSGYLIGSESLISPYTDGVLDLEFVKHSNLFDRENKETNNA